jgi:hypothetical protein
MSIGTTNEKMSDDECRATLFVSPKCTGEALHSLTDVQGELRNRSSAADTSVSAGCGPLAVYSRKS